MIKAIKGYEGLYEISDIGEVFSLNFKKLKGRKGQLKPFLSHAYKRVCLIKNGKRKQITIHRLVAMAFVENPENKKTVNHKNGITTDNRAENLEWMTLRENDSHRWDVLHRKPVYEGRTGALHPTSIAVIMTTRDGKISKRFGSIEEAARETGVHGSSIGRCMRGEYAFAGGYKWARV